MKRILKYSLCVCVRVFIVVGSTFRWERQFWRKMCQLLRKNCFWLTHSKQVTRGYRAWGKTEQRRRHKAALILKVKHFWVWVIFFWETGWAGAYWNVDKLQEEWSTMRVGNRKMQKEWWRREEREEDGGGNTNRVWSLPKNASFWNWGQMSSGKASPQNFSDTAHWLRFSPPAGECNSSLNHVSFYPI